MKKKNKNQIRGIAPSIDMLLYSIIVLSIALSFFVVSGILLYVTVVVLLLVSALESKLARSQVPKDVFATAVLLTFSIYIILWSSFNLAAIVVVLSLFAAVVIIFVMQGPKGASVSASESSSEITKVLEDIPDDIPPKWKKYFETVFSTFDKEIKNISSELEKKIKKISSQVSMAVTMRTLELAQSVYNTYSAPEYQSIKNSVRALAFNLSDNELFMVDIWYHIVDMLDSYMSEAEMAAPAEWVLTPIAQICEEILEKHDAVFGQLSFGHMKKRHRVEEYGETLAKIVQKNAKSIGIIEAALTPINDPKMLQKEVSKLLVQIDGIGNTMRGMVNKNGWDISLNQLFSGTSKYEFSKDASLEGKYKSNELRNFLSTYEKFLEDLKTRDTDSGMILTPLYAWIFIFNVYVEAFENLNCAKEELEELTDLRKSR